GVLRSLSLNFIKNGQLEQRFGKDLNWLASLRRLGDYGETAHVTESSAKQALELATQFVVQAKSLLQDGT
ncbi:MAG: DNA-binding protein, partial [Leptolyngbya sp. SIO3F4]|nr:DNA-binding protein [Leptolyngbya sp. SIO3F4]